VEKDTLKLLRLAKGFLDAEDDFKAVRILRKLIKEKRGEHYPAEWLAERYFKRKEWKPALYYAQEAFEASEKKEILNHIIGVSATACNKIEQADKAWEALNVSERDWKGVFVGLYYETYNEKKVYRAEMISPCLARVSSIPFPNSTLCVGDLVLLDRRGTGKAFDEETHIDIYPYLDRMKRTFYKVFSCRLEQCSLSEFRMLLYLCQKNDVFFDVWSNSTVHFLGSKKQKNPEIYLGLENANEGKSHYVALAGQRKLDILKVLLDWKGITHKSYDLLRKH
jgi:hypothetical protein